MDSEKQWHPGSGALASVVVRTPLLPDESLGSWLCRFAIDCGTDPEGLASAVWPEARMWAVDLERSMTPERLARLSYTSRIPTPALKSALLVTWADRWLPRTLVSQSAWRWIVPNRVRGGKRSGFVSYCALCWREDRVPFYRLQWRFSWTTACRRHRTLLSDRCPVCYGTPAPHRLTVGKDLATCDDCGHDLRETPPSPYDVEQLLLLQDIVDHAVIDGTASWWDMNLSAEEWLASLSFWIGFLRRGRREGQSRVAAFTQSVTSVDAANRAIGAFDSLSVIERAHILDGVTSITHGSGEQISDMLRKSGVSRELLEPWSRVAPLAERWLNQLSRNESAPTQRRRRRSKLYGLGRPRPEFEVMRMHQRLLSTNDQ